MTPPASESRTLNVAVDRDEWLSDYYEQCGETLDPTKGIFVPETRRAGVEVSVDPESGFGPSYLDDAWEPDPNATATSSTGLVLFGNMDVGGIHVTATSTDEAVSFPYCRRVRTPRSSSRPIA